MTTLRPMRLAAAVMLAAALAGCSMFSGEKEVKVEDMPADQIFQKADGEMAAGNPTQAAKTYDEIERLYPFSQLAKRAIIMSAFASYKARDYSSARASAQRYLDLYPSDEDAAYAQHLIALSYYDNIVDVGRDQGTTEKALQSLREVVNRYPDSEYARDAQLKIDLTLDHLAGKEMEVGRYYLKRGYYAAAINRFRVVVDKYQTTSQTPEALHRIVECDMALGLDDEAKKTAAVLGHNYPGSVWYANSYELITGEKVPGAGQDTADEGFFGKVYRRVIQGKWL